MWICVKLSFSTARLDKVAAYILNELKKNSDLTGSIQAIEKLKTKVEHYNQRHGNRLKSEQKLFEKIIFDFQSKQALRKNYIKDRLPSQVLGLTKFQY